MHNKTVQIFLISEQIYCQTNFSGKSSEQTIIAPHLRHLTGSPIRHWEIRLQGPIQWWSSFVGSEPAYCPPSTGPNRNPERRTWTFVQCGLHSCQSFTPVASWGSFEWQHPRYHPACASTYPKPCWKSPLHQLTKRKRCPKKMIIFFMLFKISG